MPSRRTRRRRGHHHPTRHARWRRSIDYPSTNPPGQHCDETDETSHETSWGPSSQHQGLTRASTTPGARLQRTPVRTHRSPIAVPVHTNRRRAGFGLISAYLDLISAYLDLISASQKLACATALSTLSNLGLISV